LAAIAVAAVTLAPGLGEVRSRFARAQPVWIVIACVCEGLSVLAYVPAFREVFCRRMRWATSYTIAVAEEGAGSLFPLGGAGSLVLRVWAPRRGEGSTWSRIAPALSATSEGIHEALHRLRQANPLVLVGLAGYLVFDQLAFWASFRAVDASAELAVIWMAYLIGQLGNWLPIPGGIGGVELGLVGALVLYRLPPLTATAAVLLNRIIELWIPAVLGIAAFIQLRLLLRRETAALALCQPGDTIEIIGLGPATIDRSGVAPLLAPAAPPVLPAVARGAPE
jgi:uncharacterized membrane protein YbhN (UPF0104 family)